MAKGKRTPQKRRKGSSESSSESSSSEDEERSQSGKQRSSRRRRCRKRERKEEPAKKESESKATKKNLTPKKRSLEETNESAFQAQTRKSKSKVDENKRNKASGDEKESSSSSHKAIVSPTATVTGVAGPINGSTTISPVAVAAAAAAGTVETAPAEHRGAQYQLVTPLPPSLDAVQAKRKAIPSDETNIGDITTLHVLNPFGETESIHDPTNSDDDETNSDDDENDGTDNRVKPRALLGDLEQKLVPSQEEDSPEASTEIVAQSRPTNPWSMRIVNRRRSSPGPATDVSGQQEQEQEQAKTQTANVSHLYQHNSNNQVSLPHDDEQDEPVKHHVQLLAPSRRPARLSPSTRSAIKPTRSLSTRRKGPPTYSKTVSSPPETLPDSSRIVPPSDGDCDEYMNEKDIPALFGRKQPRRSRYLILMLALLKLIALGVTGATIGITFWILWNAPYEQPTAFLLSDGSAGSDSTRLQKTLDVFRDALPNLASNTPTKTTSRTSDRSEQAMKTDTTEKELNRKPMLHNVQEAESEPVAKERFMPLVEYFLSDSSSDDGMESTKVASPEERKKPLVKKLVTSYIAFKEDSNEAVSSESQTKEDFKKEERNPVPTEDDLSGSSSPSIMRYFSFAMTNSDALESDALPKKESTTRQRTRRFGGNKVEQALMHKDQDPSVRTSPKTMQHSSFEETKYDALESSALPNKESTNPLSHVSSGSKETPARSAPSKKEKVIREKKPSLSKEAQPPKLPFFGRKTAISSAGAPTRLQSELDQQDPINKKSGPPTLEEPTQSLEEKQKRPRALIRPTLRYLRILMQSPRRLLRLVLRGVGGVFRVFSRNPLADTAVKDALIPGFEFLNLFLTLGKVGIWLSMLQN